MFPDPKSTRCRTRDPFPFQTRSESDRISAASRPPAWLAARVGLLALSALLAACAGPKPAPTSAVAIRESAAETTVRGDWDDVDAAVATGVPLAESAIVRAHPPSPDTHRFDIKTLNDFRGRITVTRATGSAGPTGQTGASAEAPDPHAQNIPITIRCEMVRPTAPSLQAAARIVAEIAKRLDQLQGVEFAPAE